MVYEEVKDGMIRLNRLRRKQEQTELIIAIRLISSLSPPSSPSSHYALSSSIRCTLWNSASPQGQVFQRSKGTRQILGYRKDRDLSDTMHVTWRADFIHELLQKAFWVCCLTSGMFLLIS